MPMSQPVISQISGIAILAYFFAILLIGLTASRNADGDTSMYFLSGRKLGWFSIGVSLVAADALCGHVMGVKGPFADAMAIDLELMGILGLAFLGWGTGAAFGFVNSFTTNDSLQRMYGGRVGTFVSLLFISTYLLVRLSLVLLLGSFLVGYFSNWDVNAAIAVTVLISGIYSITGGFSAVVNTQIVQAVFMFLGLAALIVGILGAPLALQTEALGTKSVFVSGIQGANHFPWLAIVIGVPVVAFWLWLTDQYVLQHVFSARSKRDLRKGITFVAVAKGAAVGALVVLLFRTPMGSYVGTARFFLPSFLRVVVLIGIFSAIMSSLSGLFNSTSALFTMDIYRRRKPKAEERKLVLVGRLSTTVVVLISLLWMPLVALIGWQGARPLQSLLACFAAVVASVFLTGVFWKRATPVAAIIAIFVGIASAAFRVILDKILNPIRIQNGILLWLLRTHYLNFAAIDFILCILVIVTVSYFAPSVSSMNGFQEAQRNGVINYN